MFNLTREQRHAIMDANPPTIEGIHWANAYFDWSWQGCGFGQASFSFQDGKLTCEDECMGRERVRTILIALANHIADNAELASDDPRLKEHHDAD